VRGGRADIEIQGLKNQPVTLQVSNALGAIVWQQTVPNAAAALRTSVPLPSAAGLYMLRVSTASGSTSVKLLKQ
jgi:hypothetical protein